MNEDKGTKCCNCGGSLPSPKYDDDGNMYCKECFDEWTMTCYDCGYRYYIRKMISNSCPDCTDRTMKRCSD